MAHFLTGMLICAFLVWAAPLQATLIDTSPTGPSSAGTAMQRPLVAAADAFAGNAMPGVPRAGKHAAVTPSSELERGAMLRIATPGSASRASPISLSSRPERNSMYD